MSAPEQILKGTTYLVTRRCSERRFFLRPSEAVNCIFQFVLAVAAWRYGIKLHAFCVMSDHYHIVLTDPDARLPDFCTYLNAFVARAMNALLGHWDAFWARGSYSAVRLESPDAIVEKTAYTLANPVEAGLVRTGRLWPGPWSDPNRNGADPVEVSRPRHCFFAENGSFPLKAMLELSTPPGFASPAEFRERVLAELGAREKEAQESRGSCGFLGVARVLAQDPRAKPSIPEPRRKLKPRVAARDESTRIAALLRLKEFARAYREAWLARRAGKAGVVFPAGTYLLRVLHGVPCVGFG